VASPYKHGNMISGSVIGKEFLDYLLKTDSVLRGVPYKMFLSVFIMNGRT
jgi:hypothetical protein